MFTLPLKNFKISITIINKVRFGVIMSNSIYIEYIYTISIINIF